jgi:DNA-binding NarL/FixJ family response regulator
MLALRPVGDRTPPAYDRRVLQPSSEDQLRPAVRALSAREVEVLELLVQGLTNTQIGARLDVGVHTIKFHLSSIFRKLGVANRTEAAIAYVRDARFDEPAADAGV